MNARAFTTQQQAFLSQARKIAPIALGREEPLYRFLRFANDKEQETVRAALVHGRFGFGRPLDFNDPFDCRPHLHLRRFKHGWFRRRSLELARERFPGDPRAEQLARTALGTASIDEHIHATETQVRAVLLNSQRMLCLAGNRVSIPMWAYYADRHRGVAIHLSPDAWPIAAAMRVSYTNRYPSVSLTKLHDKNELTRQFALKKSKAWRHEDEYRVLVQDEDTSGFDLVWEDNAARLHSGAVVGVTVGCLMDDPAIQQVVSYANAATPALPVYRSVPERKRFRLRFEQLA